MDLFLSLTLNKLLLKNRNYVELHALLNKTIDIEFYFYGIDYF